MTTESCCPLPRGSPIRMDSTIYRYGAFLNLVQRNADCQLRSPAGRPRFSLGCKNSRQPALPAVRGARRSGARYVPHLRPRPNRPTDTPAGTLCPAAPARRERACRAPAPGPKCAASIAPPARPGRRHADDGVPRVSMEERRMNRWQRIASLVTLSVVVGWGVGPRGRSPRTRPTAIPPIFTPAPVPSSVTSSIP